MYYFFELLLLSSLRLNFFAQSGLEIFFPLFFKHRDANLNYFSPLLISRI